MNKLLRYHLLAMILAVATRSALVAQCVSPDTFVVNGGGTYCAGDVGLVINLSGSQANVRYQLQLDLADTGTPLYGNGSPLSFGLHKNPGSYTVIATDTNTLCTATMSGAAIISTINCSASISDPCLCKNNATTLTNGQFDETVTVNAPSNQVWTVVSVSGLFAANSAAPPAVPTPIPVGTALSNLGNDVFELKGIHVDAIGYNVTVTNGTGLTLSIGNTCSYPNPSFTSVLSGNFCLFSDPVILSGNPGDANIVSQSFTVNGVPATQFDPSQGVGSYTIEYIVDGGAPKAVDVNDPGCIQKISTVAQVVQTPSVLKCNDFVFVTLNSNCTGEVLPDDILEGTYGCYDDYIVELDKTPPLGNGPWVAPTLTVADIGKTYQARVRHLGSGNTCGGSVVVQDNIPPQLVCQDIHLSCPVENFSPSYLKNTLGIAEATPLTSDCSNFTSSYVDNWTDLACNGSFNGVNNLSGYVRRKWTATDQWGNSTSCTQYIYLHRLHVTDVKLPADYTVSCGANVSTDPSVTGSPYFEVFGQKWPINPISGACELQTTYADQVLPACDGTYHILRSWTIFDFCLPASTTAPVNPLYHLQVIAVMDGTGPAFTCPPNTTVSVNPFGCCATVDLPDRIIEDNCSRVKSIGGMITTFDQFTGVQTGMFPISGTLTDFPGNNWWDRDTMGQWGATTCLPIGTHTVQYNAEDACGNISSCTFKLKVEDIIPPVAVCDQLTQVSLGSDGKAIVDAAEFDDGSYDICCLDGFRVGRNASSVSPTITFNCNDVGKTINVTLRVTDCSGNTSECMIQVLVDDKMKPVCSAPAHVTVTCEQFDPSLVLYGAPSALDNCCLDGITRTVSYAQFDTVCNKGSILRTFRATDCSGNTSTCTQRIVVNYKQDYFIKFPNDVIVATCDGTGNYGEPTFFGEDCELLGVTYEDKIFTVVPDACFKIERNWKIINWCTYNANNVPLCINVPNPNPAAISNAPANLPGPIVSACGTAAPWAPTVVKITPTDPSPTNYCTFWNADANCYTYQQIIKIIDTEDPVVTCTPSPDTICDLTANEAALWNEPYWWDNANQRHDLCEAPADICVTATDACSGSNINIEYQLFLDLDGDGVMETVINSINTGIAGLGWNNVPFGNVSGAGTPRQFDERAVAANQKYGFAIQETITGNNKTACVRFNTQQSQNSFVPVELPYGTHKIKWFVSDGCGNETVCEYEIIVRDCKAPTVVCNAPLSVNLMPTNMIQLWDTDFLQYTEDNCTATPYIRTGIRRCGSGSGFPLDINGQPVHDVVFTCDDLGEQCVELWAIDLAGNADYCATTVTIQDNLGNCDLHPKVDVSGFLKTEPDGGEHAIEAANVEIYVEDPLLPSSFIRNDLTVGDGLYEFEKIHVGASVTIKPTRLDNPLNGITTYDLVLISKHILGVSPLNTPYKMIAADANHSNSLTTFDIVELRKLILGIYQDFPNNTSWRFIDKRFSFKDPLNPFHFPIPETIQLTDIQTNLTDIDFIGIKIGDVNNTVVANSLLKSEDRSVGTLLFDVDDRDVKAGETFEVRFKAAEKTQAFQMTLNLEQLEVTEIPTGDKVTEKNFGIFNTASALTVSIDDADEFMVKFHALKSGKLSDMLRVSSRITKAEAYGMASAGNDYMHIALRFNSASGPTVKGTGFELYQNEPNPFVDKTSIGFHLPEASEATLTVYDETGRQVFTQKGNFTKGNNTILLDRALLNTTGLMYYTLETATETATRKMVRIR